MKYTPKCYFACIFQILPESSEDLEAAIEKILGVLQPEPFDGFTQEEVDAGVAEIDRELQQLQIKLDELEHADKEYLDREDLINPINEKQFRKMISINKRIEEEKRLISAGRRYPKRNVQERNYAELEVPDEDQFIFCDDCNMEYLGDCPEHGALVVVKDKVAKG
jgi:SCY1-like protein 2